ncbi:unnamed protein product [Pedinophyceae sp. YPF-701]|nr:unnamed protein product [Pedinophyceae sp. YPF-701]
MPITNKSTRERSLPGPGESDPPPPAPRPGLAVPQGVAASQRESDPLIPKLLKTLATNEPPTDRFAALEIEGRAEGPLHALPGGLADRPPYRAEGVTSLVRHRGGWLALFFVGLMASAFVVEEFEFIIQQHIALSYFVPLLIGHAGNSGSQASATIIRALALGEVGWGDCGRVVFKEGSAGLVVGAGLGCAVWAGSLAWPAMTPLEGLAVGVALPLVSVWANVLGGFLPLLAARVGLNPSDTAAPLMTTLVDATGLIIYFIVARMILNI